MKIWKKYKKHEEVSKENPRNIKINRRIREIPIENIKTGKRSNNVQISNCLVDYLIDLEVVSSGCEKW